MKRLLLKGFVAVVLFVGLAEGAARLALPRVGPGMIDLEDFYAPARRAAARGALSHISVGSSRVASAIAADTLQTLLRAAAAEGALGRPPQRVRFVNAGKGYATISLHYLGLRDLITRYPEATEGLTVFVEAPSGMAMYNLWENGWVGETWPTLLAPLLRTDDLPAFLASDNTLGTKLYATAAHYLYFVRYLQYVRPRLEAAVNQRLTPKRARGEEADLSTAGGVRTDEEGVNLTRAEVWRENDNAAQDQEPWREWDRSIWADVVRMVRAHGGEVIFFEMPISSVVHEGNDTPMRREDKRAFDAWRAANGLALLRTDAFVYTDEDFPDLMHLRKSRHAEFSALLAESYLAFLEGPAAPDGAPPPMGSPPDAPAGAH